MYPPRSTPCSAALATALGSPLPPPPPVNAASILRTDRRVRPDTWRPGGNLALSKGRAGAVTGSLDRIRVPFSQDSGGWFSSRGPGGTTGGPPLHLCA